MRPAERLWLVAAAALAALVAPAAAAAHVANVEYKFPLPIWLYAVAGGIAVLASAPAAALAVRGGTEGAGATVVLAALFLPSELYIADVLALTSRFS